MRLALDTLDLAQKALPRWATLDKLWPGENQVNRFASDHFMSSLDRAEGPEDEPLSCSERLVPHAILVHPPAVIN